MLLIYPGEEGDLVALLDLLRLHHEDQAAERLREIEERRANGAPLDDAIDWPALEGLSTKMRATLLAHNAGDTHAVALEVVTATASALLPLPPFKPDPRLAGVRVRFRVLEERRRRALGAAEARALGAFTRAWKVDDDVGVATATDDIFTARGELLRESLVEAWVGEQRVSDKGDVALALLERNGLLTPIAAAASAFQELGPKKAGRSGSSLGSTSGASSAPSAQSLAVALEDAMAAPSIEPANPWSSPAPGGRPTPVHGGT